MKFAMEWTRSCWRLAWRRIIVMRRYRRRIELLKHSLSLAEMENASLQRQLEAATDTLQAFGLHNRAIGMEAKVYGAQIVKATQP